MKRPQTLWQEPFTLAIHGDGRLLPRLLQALETRYPQVTVYDRRKPVDWPESFGLVPDHPEVADVDVIANRSGACDHVTLRCQGQHRFFNCASAPGQTEPGRLDRTLDFVVISVGQLLLATAQAAAQQDRPAARMEATAKDGEAVSEPGESGSGEAQDPGQEG